MAALARARFSQKTKKLQPPSGEGVQSMRPTEIVITEDVRARGSPEEKDDDDPLPDGWVKLKSQSKPGTFYYYNQSRNQTRLFRPGEKPARKFSRYAAKMASRVGRNVFDSRRRASALGRSAGVPLELRAEEAKAGEGQQQLSGDASAAAAGAQEQASNRGNPLYSDGGARRQRYSVYRKAAASAGTSSGGRKRYSMYRVQQKVRGSLAAPKREPSRPGRGHTHGGRSGKGGRGGRGGRGAAGASAWAKTTAVEDDDEAIAFDDIYGGAGSDAEDPEEEVAGTNEAYRKFQASPTEYYDDTIIEEEDEEEAGEEKNEHDEVGNLGNAQCEDEDDENNEEIDFEDIYGASERTVDEPEGEDVPIMMSNVMFSTEIETELQDDDDEDDALTEFFDAAVAASLSEEEVHTLVDCATKEDGHVDTTAIAIMVVELSKVTNLEERTKAMDRLMKRPLDTTTNVEQGVAAEEEEQEEGVKYKPNPSSPDNQSRLSRIMRRTSKPLTDLTEATTNMEQGAAAEKEKQEEGVKYKPNPSSPDNQSRLTSKPLTEATTNVEQGAAAEEEEQEEGVKYKPNPSSPDNQSRLSRVMRRTSKPLTEAPED